nr:hypothetical protein Iba_chr05cCG10790 [Ipomoea batatas]
MGYGYLGAPFHLKVLGPSDVSICIAKMLAPTRITGRLIWRMEIRECVPAWVRAPSAHPTYTPSLEVLQGVAADLRCHVGGKLAPAAERASPPSMALDVWPLAAPFLLEGLGFLLQGGATNCMGATSVCGSLARAAERASPPSMAIRAATAPSPSGRVTGDGLLSVAALVVSSPLQDEDPAMELRRRDTVTIAAAKLVFRQHRRRTMEARRRWRGWASRLRSVGEDNDEWRFDGRRWRLQWQTPAMTGPLTGDDGSFDRRRQLAWRR